MDERRNIDAGASTLPMMPCDGDVLAFRGVGFWSSAIKVRTASRVSHIGFAYRHRGSIWVIEAKERIGVRLVPLSLYMGNSAVQVDWHPLLAREHGIDRADLIDAALGHVGKPYASVWQFVRSWGLISRRLCDYLGWPADTNPGRFFCSEFLIDAVRWAGYSGNGHHVAARSSPGDVLELECVGKGRRLS